MFSKFRNPFQQIFRNPFPFQQIFRKSGQLRRTYMGSARPPKRNIHSTTNNSKTTEEHANSFESFRQTGEQILSSGMNQAKMFEDHLMRSKLHFRIFVGSMIGIGTAGVVFSDSIKSVFVKQTSELTAQTLSDEEVLKQGKLLVHNIISDIETQNLVSSLLYQLIQRPDVQENLKTLVFQVLNDPQTLKVLTDLLSNLVKLKVTQDLLANLIHDVFNREDVQSHVKKLVDGVIVDENIRSSLEEQLNKTLNEVMTNPDNIAQLGTTIRGSIGYAFWPWGKGAVQTVETQTEPVAATEIPVQTESVDV